MKAGGANPQPVVADRYVVGQPGETKLARVTRRRREIKRERVARSDHGVIGRGRIALPWTDRRRTEIVDASKGVGTPGLHRDNKLKLPACLAYLFQLGINDAYAGARIDQHKLTLQRRQTR